ncbi:MAG: peptidoglycan-binding protein, partial [Rhodobacteraceae bacterium]|nr:peptidoglycan-binding protein [Paracoccaceae bacterium]
LTAQQIAANPQGVRGLLVTYRDQTFGAPAPLAQPQAPQTTVVVVPQQAEPQQAAPAPLAAAAPALPNFLGEAASQASLASHCNQVSLVTNSNGGYVTLASMSDPGRALNEQFCLARTYAVAAGEDLAARVPGTTPQQIAAQCQAFGPALREHVAAVSLKAPDEVLAGVGSFALSTGMAPAQLAGTATICLSSGYRTDDMEVAIGSALLLVALGEQPYAELIGHHLTQGFGTSRRADLGRAWFDIGFAALDQGAPAVFNPGQADRADLLRAALGLPGQAAITAPTVTPAASTPAAGALPSFVVTKEAPSK